MPSRDDVLIQRNAISSTDLKRLLQHVHEAHQTDSLVSNFDESIDAEWVVNRKIRDTQEVELPESIRHLWP